MSRSFKKVKGRPISKPTSEIQEKIVSAIVAGNYTETAAIVSGVNKKIFNEWLLKGRKQKTGIYSDFLNAIEKAQAEAEMKDIEIINMAAEKDWQAAAWRLERKFPERWGKRI
jgi:hypothetical protein